MKRRKVKSKGDKEKYTEDLTSLSVLYFVGLTLEPCLCFKYDKAKILQDGLKKEI